MRPHTLSPALLATFAFAQLQLTQAITLSNPLLTPTPTSVFVDTISGLAASIDHITTDTYSVGQPTQPPEPPDVDKRWVNICHECVGSTGTTSFKGARKSLTNDNDKYKKAKTTLV